MKNIILCLFVATGLFTSTGHAAFDTDWKKTDEFLKCKISKPLVSLCGVIDEAEGFQELRGVLTAINVEAAKAKKNCDRELTFAASEAYHYFILNSMDWEYDQEALRNQSELLDYYIDNCRYLHRR